MNKFRKLLESQDVPTSPDRITTDIIFGLASSMVLDTNFLDPNSTLAQIIINTFEKRGECGFSR
ncbi:hypothetical protein GCM10010911_70290 [Paenibacillus nasutitermitis]|uniref:Uncharacterized protein n=1 Tax=Paenibacillus nasutitermitis TaxID=1652958 RepID=A0A917E3H0_9BACL|nr:hypothetical protein GCM10010911_70290 [Paenibacillus nasutitermitis]